MEKYPIKKPQPLNFKDPAAQKAYVEEIRNNKELMQRELDVNRSEKILLEKRIRMMGEFLNDLPASDPQYSVLATQIQMDKIELDELNIRAINIEENLDESS